MSAKPYRVIFTLLILSVFFILVLQGLWIRNFYLQKQEEFGKTIYAALENVTLKLRERQNLGEIKQNISLDTLPVTKQLIIKNPLPSGTNIHIQVRNEKKSLTGIKAMDITGLKNEMREVTRKDSAVFVVTRGDSAGKQKKTMNRYANVNDKEMQLLVEKMITEIRITDTDERNPDTLKQVIKRVFENKGLFLPFEFALKKVFKNKDETLAKSEGYNNNLKSYISDLSANNVFSTHNFLFVQFPKQGGYLLSSIKNMVLLSLVFSLIIMGVFYYTIRLIINQKKLGEIKNDFVNNMTHELKTPIATNSLAIDALANPLIKNDDEKYNDYIRILKEENKKLNVHVERVLQIALLDKGELPLNKKPLDLALVVEQVVEQFKLRISEQKAEVRINRANHALVVLGDEQHLQTVFSNLLDNALKYSSEACTIIIDALRNENEIIIRMKDNGPGIAKEHREKVFEKFYRIQGGNLHDVKGFGLGLSYVKSIVESHQGSITLTSEVGRGTEFTIKWNAYV